MITLAVALLLSTFPQDSLHLRVLATHDFHGALLARPYEWSAGRPIGGAAALGAYIARRREECECVSLYLDGGDQMQGTLESNLDYGASTVRMFNRLGLDAAAIGNHELDWGPDTLRARLREAAYPWLAANVYDSVTARRPEWARASALLQRRGMRIGVVGYVTSSTKRIVMPRHVAGLVFRPGYEAIADALTDIERAEPDFLVLVAHAAADCDSAGCTGEIAELVRTAPPGIFDLIVSGHAHSSGSGVVEGVPILRASSSARALAVVDLFKGGDGGTRFSLAVDTVYADVVEPAPAIALAVDSIRRRTDAIASRVVGELRTGLSREDPWLGNMVTDALRHAVRADVALTNAGGLRRDFGPGPVTYGELYELYPFGNQISVLQVTGAELRKVAAYAARGGSFHVSGIRVHYDVERQLVTALTLADGPAVRDGDTYSLAVPDFLAEGAAGFPFAGRAATTDRSVLDAIVGWIDRSAGPVDAPTDRRIVTTSSGGSSGRSERAITNR
jgi:2',3'-cyclic-nucleotide 2'-phosphodiesterase (5'-nucleotidase family)